MENTIKEYTITVFTENQIGLLNRVSIIFTRRKLNIESITASESEVKGIHRYTLVLKTTPDMVNKVIGQIEKQVEVLKAYSHENTDIIYQEIALYKVPTSIFANGDNVERLVRSYGARILNIEPEYTVIEKTGQEHETEELHEKLKEFGLLGFVRSGRVALVRGIGKFTADLRDMDVDQVDVNDYLNKSLLKS